MVYISPIKIIRKRQKKKKLSIIEIEYFYLYNMICIYKPNIKYFILIRCWIRCVYNIKHGFKISNMDYKYCLISVYKHDKHQQLFIGFHWFYVGFFLYYFLSTPTVRILKKKKNGSLFFFPISTFEEVTLEFMPNLIVLDQIILLLFIAAL
jgi:hypothetical protein